MRTRGAPPRQNRWSDGYQGRVRAPRPAPAFHSGAADGSALAADAVVVAVQAEGVGRAHRERAVDVVGAVAGASGAVVVADAVLEAPAGVGGVAVPRRGAGRLRRLARGRGPIPGGGRGLAGGRWARGRRRGRGGGELGGRRRGRDRALCGRGGRAGPPPCRLRRPELVRLRA